ncbi:acyl-CoA dehydrogenase family protein [Nocardiopsis sp. ATB16-24]|uniref:acyl-CoA dehydrogenase family protein n=1 Tax=Nocardiopsis sp. ATB16-24 TaxID=3019555 RepID=UPI00255396A8|nr:acyl-CoA dehydrogenase family protein [Nocardiopsis sp. ATB16-24]
MMSSNEVVDSPFTEEEEDARAVIRTFLQRELEPVASLFVDDPSREREFWRRAGEAGVLGANIDERYGGPGMSALFGVVLSYELGRSPAGAIVGSSITADPGATHVLMSGGSEEHKHRLAKGIMSGDLTPAFAVTEPEAGSDALAMRTHAVRDGDEYVLNGSKTFISNGNKAELIYLAAKTDPTRRGAGVSMFLVEGQPAGLSRVRMKTMGYPAYDLAELYFDDVRVPAENLLLGEGRGMELMMSTFALDRLQMAARALGEADLAMELALEHAKTREMFGKSLFDFQNTKFVLADMKTQIEVGRAFLHEGIRKYRADRFTMSDGAMLKVWIPEMAGRVIDDALQLFGGSGFMDEMPIAQLYKGSRLHRLYAGTTEIQKETIARSL